MKAIVYISNTGHTKKYAELIGEKTGLPVYELSEAKKTPLYSSNGFPSRNRLYKALGKENWIYLSKYCLRCTVS